LIEQILKSLLENLERNYLKFYFYKKILSIKNINKKASFLAIDLEMTGIRSENENFFDLPFERYSKVKIFF